MQKAIAAAFAVLLALPLATSPAFAANHGGGGVQGTTGFRGGAGGFRGGAAVFRHGAGSFRGREGFRGGDFGRGFYGRGFYGGGFGAVGGLVFDPAFDWEFGPFYEPYDYGFYDPYAYAEPPILVPPLPAPGIAPAPAVPGSQYWYYCANPAGYFPYIRQCQVPWQTVPAGVARPN
jgi:hypothetical protein